METINTYKLINLYETIIKDRLLSIFYDRWLIESGEAWKNNAAFGSVIRNKLPILYNKFKGSDKKYTDNGQIYKLGFESLFLIILNSNSFLNSNNNNNIKIINQNKIIHKLLLYINNYDNDENFNDYINKVGEAIKELDELTNRNSSGDSVEIEINNKFKDCSGLEDGGVNFSINDKKAIEMNNKGLIEFKLKNYHKSRDYYYNALELEFISDSIKAELSLNLSDTLLEIVPNLTKDPNSILMDNQDYVLIDTSRVFCMESILLRPCWSYAYYKASFIFSRLGDYEFSLTLLQCFKILKTTTTSSNNNNNNNNNNTQDIDKLINQLNDKIKIQSGTTTTRNFEKEAKLIIDKYGCFMNQFKDIKLTESYVLKILSMPNAFGLKLIEFKSYSKYTGLSINHLYEKIVLNNVRDDDICFDIKKRIDAYYKCIGNNSNWAEPYYLLAHYKMYNEEPPSVPLSSSNKKLIVSLLLKASLLPLHHKINISPTPTTTPIITIKPETIFTHNYFVPIAQFELGRIYRYGLYDEDYDLEKAQYYFEQSIKNSTPPPPINNDNDSYFKLKSTDSYYHLGRMYYQGINKDRKTDLELTQKYWKLGSELGSYDCNIFLKMYFNVEPQQTIDCDNNNNDKFEFEKAMYSTENLNFDISVYTHPIDFSIIKQMSDNKQHQYANSIYSTHLKVVKFIKLFKQLNTYKKSGGGKLKEKIEVIKILSLAFRDYDNFKFIRIPQTIINDVKELVDQLLELSPSNIDVRICWLGLSRMNYYQTKNKIDFTSTLQFISNSINLCKNGDKDYSIFKYYQIIYQGYNGDFEIKFNNLIHLLKNDGDGQGDGKLVESDKDIFIYLLLSIVNSPISSSINNDHHIKLIISNVDSFNSRSIKGNPQNAEINLNLYLLLLNSNYENEIASKYLKIGKSEIEYLIPSLKEFNTKLDKLLSLIK